ncbi:MAG: response regulator transcription factor [Acidimicrobiales bacterium]
MSTIWVVEDDASIGRGLIRALEADGHTVELAPSAEAARALTSEPAVVLLDLGLPDADGIDLCREVLAAHPGTRVMMLTARDTEMDIVVGLDAGAIDYLTKPFRLAELMARVRAQLRSGASGPAPTEDVIEVADLRIELRGRRVFVGGASVDLRAKEFDLLARLASEPGSVIGRETLMSDVWDEHWFGSTKTLDVHMASLRRHLGEDPGSTSRITTIRGVGYRLEP